MVLYSVGFVTALAFGVFSRYQKKVYTSWYFMISWFLCLAFVVFMVFLDAISETVAKWVYNQFNVSPFDRSTSTPK
jgi:energy-coupling factor transporter transmembrane protein EcfT